MINNECQINIITSSTQCELCFSGHNDFMFDLLNCFVTGTGQTGKPKIECEQKRTKELLVKLNSFAESCEDKELKNSAFKIYDFIRDLKDNENFLILPVFGGLDKQYLDYLKFKLQSEELNIPLNDFIEQYNSLMGPINENYDIYLFGTKYCNKVEGDTSKEGRTCRFCGRVSPNASFSKKAHSISEALGNKTIITPDECDDCNKSFGDTIENDFIEYISLFRTIRGIQGKNGVPQIGSLKKKETSLSYTPNSVNVFTFDTISEFPGEITLPSTSFNPQNVYRALCKYALSVLPASLLSNFTETIKWIRSDKSLTKVPPVARCISPQVNQQPTITVFVRKVNSYDLPYTVAFLNCCGLDFVYIVPLASNDQKKFDTQSEYDAFWNKFLFKDNKFFCFETLCADQKIKFSRKIKLTQIKR